MFPGGKLEQIAAVLAAWRDLVLALCGLGLVRGCRNVALARCRAHGRTRKRCGALGRHSVEHLVCVEMAGSRSEKVNSSGLGWVGQLKGGKKRRGGGELGRGKEREGGPNEQWHFTFSQGFGIEF